jgi:hypothetical protein
VDVVIVEQSLFKMMPNILGREFQLKKKFPLGIPGRECVTKWDLGQQISYVLKKRTNFYNCGELKNKIKCIM